MIRERETVLRRIILGVDGILISMAYVLSYFIKPHLAKLPFFRLFGPSDAFPGASGTLSEHLLFLLLVVSFWCLMLYLNGMYRPLRTRALWMTIWILVKTKFLADLAFGMFVFMFKVRFISRRFFVLYAMLSFIFVLTEKILIYFLMHYVRRRGRNQKHLLVVGTGRRAAEFIHKITVHPEWGLKILGAIDDEPGRGVESVDGVKILGGLNNIPEMLHGSAIDEVVFVVPRRRLHYLENAIRQCEIEGVRVTIAVDLFNLKIAKSYQTELDGMPLLTFKTTVPSEWELFLKRMIDIVVSGICILAFSPFLLVFSMLIRLTSKGPVFYKQERVGLNGRKFVMYKFRTMYIGAQEKLSRVDIYREIYEPQWKKTKLQYITPIGRILRKLSLDEFPQLFNVFWGRMSLVGPRPTLPQEVKQYEAWHRRRFSMRPGLTCLWQIKGRREIKFNEWMQLDLEYLDNWSLWLDVRILIKTIPAVLLGHGAY
jgi:exopolysaccharide biosynthesis polyprenyl glycosylphosphotransferase